MDYISVSERIGNKIKELRKEAGWTQEILAHEMNLSENSRSTIRNWEKGERLPTTDQLIQLCGLFHCDIGFLFGDYEQRYRSLADISEITGLSESAIRRILALRNGAPYLLSILNQIIEAAEFLPFLAEIQNCQRNLELAKSNSLVLDADYERLKGEAQKRGWLLMSFTDVALQHRSEAEHECQKLIEELTGMSRELEG